MTRQLHEFLHALQPTYGVCHYCGERKSLVCLKCSYCYECHPAVGAERRASRIMMDDVSVA